MSRKYPILSDFLESSAVREIAGLVALHNKVPIYQLHFPTKEEVSREAYEWATRLFLNCQLDDARPEPKIHENRIVLTHPDGYRIRAYEASGCLEFRDLRRVYQGETTIDALPAAEKIVRKFAIQRGVLSNEMNQELKAERLQLIRNRGAIQELMTEVKDVNAVLVLQRMTGGIPWIGPGSRVIAIIEGRDVVGFERTWRQIIPTPTREVEALGLEEVFVRFLDRHALKFGRPIPRGTFSLERVEFGYFAFDKYRLQRFAQPAYQVFYRTNGQTRAALVDILPAHDLKIEPVLIADELARQPVRR